MPRARGGIMADYRKVRALSYRVARGMGNLQPILEGDIPGLLRRQIRRVIGKAMARAAFGGEGSGGQWGIVRDIGLMLIGRWFQARR